MVARRVSGIQLSDKKNTAVEMTYLQAGVGVTRIDWISNEDVYERYGMAEVAPGVNCGVVEWVKRNASMVWTCKEDARGKNDQTCVSE